MKHSQPYSRLSRSAWLLTLSALTFAASHTALAQGGIYRCVKDGQVSFTNVSEESRGCKKVSEARAPRSAKPNASDQVAEMSFPKVDAKTQQKRDESRDTIIRRELTEQKKNLEELSEKLAHFEIIKGDDQQKQIERFKALNEERRSREKNIAELEKQLGQ